ncbi:MAG: radical SAM protein [Nitrospirae bacterium]|nr:radical SAM protein [Nitrospirota bacterium]
MNKLPAPHPDRSAYEQVLCEGFSKYPERKDNFQRYEGFKKQAVVNYLPIKMDYETTSRCNFRCIMCRIQEYDGGKRAKDLSFEDFSRSLDELYGLIEIKLQGLGEPLLNKDIFKMISYAAQRYIWIRMTTNGSLLNVNDNYKRLIDSNPSEVQVSIDGASEAVFETIRRGSNFGIVIRNAALLNEYAESLGLTEKTRCWTVVQNANAGELFEIIRLADKMKFRRLTFSVTLSNFGDKHWEQRNQLLSADQSLTENIGAELIEFGANYGIEVTFWDGSEKYILGNENRLCAWIFERAYISSDMRIVPCCVISTPDVCDFGDARDFINVWNSEIYRSLRLAHINGNLPDFCKQCYG